MAKQVDEVTVCMGAELQAPDGRPLGRLTEVGLDHFGHVVALLGGRGVHAAAGIRSVSADGAVVVVDPEVPQRTVVAHQLAQRTPAWTTDDTKVRVLGFRADSTTRHLTSVLARRRRGKVRDLPWGMVYPETQGVPLAAYWNRREDLAVTHPLPQPVRRWRLLL
ncbi:MAG TPA: hypothetical protein VH134_02825 [Candidatus Dormibacteraeota bacterium]|jgi:hypothetical protein|nr:hypothetical protein [Candidatus Dormibacteraeota bacterium]